MNIKTLRANLMLMICAMIWGSAFVAQSSALDNIAPFTFNAIRMTMGSLVLLPVIFVMNRLSASKTLSDGAFEQKKICTKELLYGSAVCGVVLFLASTTQNYGLLYTSAAKAGFITTLYIVLVPILSRFIFRKTPHWLTWIYACVAVCGFFVMSVGADFSISPGDLMVLLSSLLFAFHIMVIDHYSPRVDPVALSSGQFFAVGVLSLIAALIFERDMFSWTSLNAAAGPILYAGICSCGIAYTFQTVGQKDTDPTVAALILSLESVFAALSGWLILDEMLTPKEYIGCAIVFAAVIMSQIPIEKLKKPKK